MINGAFEPRAGVARPPIAIFLNIVISCFFAKR
jgi:hypothetical protein